jgi:hypothetical protein
VLDLGSGSVPTSIVRRCWWATGHVVGVDITDEQLDKAARLRDREGSRRWSYREAVEAQGLQVEEVRKNDYRFISERALEAYGTCEVESISLVAVKTR